MKMANHLKLVNLIFEKIREIERKGNVCQFIHTTPKINYRLIEELYKNKYLLKTKQGYLTEFENISVVMNSCINLKLQFSKLSGGNLIYIFTPKELGIKEEKDTRGFKDGNNSRT